MFQTMGPYWKAFFFFFFFFFFFSGLIQDPMLHLHPEGKVDFE